MLTVTNLNVNRGRNAVLRAFALDARMGEIVALRGPNGSGKSTALHAIAGLLPIESGEVAWVRPSNPSHPGDGTLISDCGLLLQGGRVFRSLTVELNLRVAAHDLGQAELEVRIANLRNRFGAIDRNWSQRAGALSGGERQVVALSMVLVRRPSLLLLDEPLAGVDAPNVSAVTGLLQEMKIARDVAIVVVEHRDAAIDRIADRVVVLK